MQIEIRSDQEARITGYVNATEKLSRPVITPHGKVVEVIEPRAFAEAIERGGDISLNVDHDKGHVYAYTSDGTLKLTEDAIGLHADVLIRDPTLIALAKDGKIRGWSFGMYNVRDELEPRAEALPLRHIRGLDLDHVSLIVNQTPVYSATSVEVRADADVWNEVRSLEDRAEITDHSPREEPAPAPEPDDGARDRAARKIQLMRARRRE